MAMSVAQLLHEHAVDNMAVMMRIVTAVEQRDTTFVYPKHPLVHLVLQRAISCRLRAFLNSVTEMFALTDSVPEPDLAPETNSTMTFGSCRAETSDDDIDGTVHDMLMCAPPRRSLTHTGICNHADRP